jgi:hypothetical protein
LGFGLELAVIAFEGLLRVARQFVEVGGDEREVYLGRLAPIKGIIATPANTKVAARSLPDNTGVGSGCAGRRLRRRFGELTVSAPVLPFLLAFEPADALAIFRVIAQSERVSNHHHGGEG